MKPIKQLLPPGDPDSGVYAALQPAARPVRYSGHEAGRRPRALSEKQRKTFLGTAVVRIAEEAKDRNRRWLRRLDTMHASGSRTHQQRYNALAALAEPLFARVDLATLCLGWLDDRGAFRLNRQRPLAQDSGLSECCVSRTLTALEKCGYIRRKLRRIYQNGQRWITRVTIHLRPAFFIDLGLGHHMAAARTAKKIQRRKRLRDIATVQQQEALQELADQQMRRQSHRKAEGKRAANVASLDAARKLDALRRKAGGMAELSRLYPALSPQQIAALYDQQNPPN